MLRGLEREAWIWGVPLHGSLTSQQQKDAFKAAPAGKVKVVVSTNVAETSITIPDVTAVVDALVAKETGFDPERNLPCLKEVWIARDAADQRKGRAGRVRAGCCYRLATRRAFEARPAHSTPEIKRVSLENLALQVLAMGLDPFAFGSTLLDPPSRPALASSVDGLRSMGALDAAADAPTLSALGGHLAALPCAARLGKLLVLGATLGCRREALSIAAGLSVRSPWKSGEADRASAAATKQRLRETHACGRSDHALVALAFDEFARDAAAAPRGPWQRKRALGPLLHEKGLAYDPLNDLSLIHISEPTRQEAISYAVFC